MAKKRKMKKTVGKKTGDRRQETSVDNAGGKVTCTLGVKTSASYQSQDFSLSAELPIQPGEKAGDAIDRCYNLVDAKFEDLVSGTLDNLIGHCLDKKTEGKRRT